MKHRFDTAGHSEAFLAALRHFEQGLFETAGEELLGVLKTDPGDREAQRLLRLIERRLWPRPAPAPTLVWQFRPEEAWERDWLRLLLGPLTANEVVDNSWSFLAETMIVVDNRLIPEKAPYYQRAFENGCKVILVHLSDEAFKSDLSAYRYCEAVIRNYRSDMLAEQARILFLPLGYKAGFARASGSEIPAKTAAQRKHLWSFVGDPNKFTRGAMLEAMASVAGGFRHITSGFNAADALSTEAYRTLLDESVFVPCPGGWSNLETFRVYEALEAGCIPIVEKRKGFNYFSALLGDHPIPTIAAWPDAAAMVHRLQAENRTEALRRDCAAWWSAYKQRLGTSVAAFVTDALAAAAGGAAWPKTYAR